MVELARKVLKNSIFNGLRAIISGIGGFMFSIVLARLLTPEQFGIYALAMSICFFILQLDPGIGTTATRYIAYAIGKNDILLVRGYFKFLFKIRILLGIMFSLSLAIIAKFLAYSVFNKPHLFIPLLTLSIFMFFFYLSDFVDCCCVAFQNFKYPTIRQTVYESLKFVFVILFVLVGFYNGIFIGLALASLLTFIIIFYIFKKRYNFIFEKRSKSINKKRVLRFMVFLSIGSFSWVVFGYIDMIMIGIFLPAEYAGYYKAATNIIYGICGLTGLTTVLFPIFTQLEGESMESAFKKVFKYSCIVTIPFAFSIAFFSDEIVRAIYGANYIPSTIALAILTPIIITNAINFFGDLLTAKEKPEFTTAISILSMITNIVLNYILIPMYGIAGAAFATSFSRVLNLVSMGIISKMIVGISLDILLVCKPTFSSVLMILLFHILPKPESILEGILEFLTGIFFYFFVMFLIRGITREDIRYIKSILSISTTSV